METSSRKLLQLTWTYAKCKPVTMPRKVGVRVNQHYHYIRHVLFRHLVPSSSEPIAVFASFCIFKLSVVVAVQWCGPRYPGYWVQVPGPCSETVSIQQLLGTVRCSPLSCRGDADPCTRDAVTHRTEQSAGSKYEDSC